MDVLTLFLPHLIINAGFDPLFSFGSSSSDNRAYCSKDSHYGPMDRYVIKRAKMRQEKQLTLIVLTLLKSAKEPFKHMNIND